MRVVKILPTTPQTPGWCKTQLQPAHQSEEEAMEALLAAMGHDVVELDRLQVQRSECKVADKWKVELCHLGKDGDGAFGGPPTSSYEMDILGKWPKING